MTADLGDEDYISQSLDSQICHAGHGIGRRRSIKMIDISKPTIQQTARYYSSITRELNSNLNSVDLQSAVLLSIHILRRGSEF